MSLMSEIQDRLMDADESRFSSDFNWLDMFDPAEDQIMSFMNDVLDDKSALISELIAWDVVGLSFGSLKGNDKQNWNSGFKSRFLTTTLGANL